MNNWIDGYFDRYRRSAFPQRIYDSLGRFHDLAREVRKADGKLMMAGNGASASIAAHGAVDFSKQAGVRAMSFSSDALITCLSNDYGYENWVAKAVEMYGQPGDALVLISSSGRSPNVVAAADRAHAMGLPVVTFTGFAADNPLRARADIDFWVDENSYNIVECTHMIWLTTVIDMANVASEALA